MSLPIKRNGDRLITVGDVGEVRRTFKEPDYITRFNGEPVFSLEVSKRNGANILDTVKGIRQAVADEQTRWPPNVKVAFVLDR